MTTKDDQLSCVTCEFFTGSERHGITGECRKHAPKPFKYHKNDIPDFYWYWPIVTEVDWCGEYEELKTL